MTFRVLKKMPETTQFLLFYFFTVFKLVSFLDNLTRLNSTNYLLIGQPVHARIAYDRAP
jgi:hypothetical protein